jgi:tetratricopeptide (TPR) repeat protein
VYYEVRAGIYLEQNQYKAAASDIEKALELSPRSAQAFFLRGTLYFHQEAYDKALKALKKAIELDPSQLEPRIQMIAVYANAGQYEKAIYEATKMLDQGIIDPVLLLNRGYAAMSLGKYDLAAGDFEKALQLNPELAEARNNLGFVRFRNGETREGRKLIEQGLRLNPQNALAYAFRALILNSEGKSDSACADLKRARALGLRFEKHPKWKFREIFDEECTNNQP